MSKAAKNKKKRNVVREHPHRKYGSKRPVTLSRKQTNLAPAQVIHRVSKGLPFSELEHLRGEIDEPLESVARRLAIATAQSRTASFAAGIGSGHAVLAIDSARSESLWRHGACAAVVEISAARSGRRRPAGLRQHRSGGA